MTKLVQKSFMCKIVSIITCIMIAAMVYKTLIIYTFKIQIEISNVKTNCSNFYVRFG